MRWLNVQMPRKCTVMCSESEHKTPTHSMKLCGEGWSLHGAATAERHSSTSSSSLSPLVQVCPSFSIAPRGPGSGLELWFDDLRDCRFPSVLAALCVCVGGWKGCVSVYITGALLKVQVHQVSITPSGKL